MVVIDFAMALGRPKETAAFSYQMDLYLTFDNLMQIKKKSLTFNRNRQRKNNAFIQNDKTFGYKSLKRTKLMNETRKSNPKGNKKCPSECFEGHFVKFLLTKDLR